MDELSEIVCRRQDSQTRATGTGAGSAAGRLPGTGNQLALKGPGARKPEAELLERGTTMQGITRLCNVLTNHAAYQNLPVDLEESELLTVLEELEYFDIHVFEAATSSAQRARAHIRYLTAIWPEASTAELGQRIHSLLNNRNMSFSDVMTVLRGERLSERAQLNDLRAVLQGASLNNTQEHTREVPVPLIQGVGRCLRGGMGLSETARVMRVSRDTVRNVERLLGLRSAYMNRLGGMAVDAVRDGVSVREFAATHCVTKSRAELLLRDGRRVLVELGEAQ